MSIKDSPSMFELLEKRQKQIFFEAFEKAPSLFNWPAVIIPDEIRCETCDGQQALAFGKPCVTCNGTGIPPIPSFEIYDPKRGSKVKK